MASDVMSHLLDDIYAYEDYVDMMVQMHAGAYMVHIKLVVGITRWQGMC